MEKARFMLQISNLQINNRLVAGELHRFDSPRLNTWSHLPVKLKSLWAQFNIKSGPKPLRGIQFTPIIN